MTESEEEVKSPLMKEESENVGLKLNIQKTKIMAYGPITSWQIDGEAMERVTYFIYLEACLLETLRSKKQQTVLGMKDSSFEHSSLIKIGMCKD